MGEHQYEPEVDVLILAATNRDLPARIRVLASGRIGSAGDCRALDLVRGTTEHVGLPGRTNFFPFLQGTRGIP